LISDCVVLVEPRQHVIGEIQKLYEGSKPLNISAVKRKSPELIDIVYSQEKYWGWKQALEDAGVCYTKINVDVQNYVVCKKCNKTFSSLMSHLKLVHQMTKADYTEEFGDEMEVISEEMKAERLSRASKKSNAELPHWEPVYTKEYLLDRLHEYHKMGKTLHARAVQKYDYALLTGARKYLGGWHSALEAIGLDSTTIRKVDHVQWSEELIVKKLLARKEQGKGLNPKSLREDDENLYVAIRRLFDNNYDAALQAAGLNPKDIRLKYK